MLDLRDYLIKNYNGKPFPKKPYEISIDCPDCDKGEFHFGFNVIKKEGRCFRCSYTVKTAVALISKLENISTIKARDYLSTGSLHSSRIDALRKAIEKNNKKEDIEIDEKHIDTDVPKEYIPIIDPGRSPKVMIPKIFKKRNYRLSTIHRMRIGYCAEGYYASRLIFPIESEDKISFYARRMFDYMPQKYKNPPGSKHSLLLYNYNNIPNDVDQLFIVEGCTDVLRMIERNYYVVGTSGKKISSEQIDLITKKRPKEVVVLYDGDAIKENHKAFLKLSYRLKSSYAFLPQKGYEKNKKIFYDPDDIPFEELKKIIKERTSMDKLSNISRILKKF